MIPASHRRSHVYFIIHPIIYVTSRYAPNVCKQPAGTFQTRRSSRKDGYLSVRIPGFEGLIDW
jgi:hypothetical protein